MKDRLLVTRCKRGSRKALQQIYEKYKNDLLILAVALVRNPGIAEDVVHDVFTCFVRDIERFQLTGSLKGYLLTCVANRARNSNKEKHRQHIELDPAQAVESELNEPVKTSVYNEQLRQLSDAMAQIPFDQREVILLHFQAGMTFEAIAERQGISVNTVKSRYKYGIDKLRIILDGEAKNESGK